MTPDQLELFNDLYSKGLTDEQIARKLNVDRTTVLRTRRKLKLSPNRQVGQRGPGRYHKNDTYFNYAARIMPYVAPHLMEAARELDIPAETKFVACLMFPRILYHPNLMSYVADPARMTPIQAEKIARAQIRHEMAGMAGVPGADVVTLAEVYKTADKKFIKELARSAVLTAGFVSTTVPVKSILDGAVDVSPVEKVKETWEQNINEAVNWTIRLGNTNRPNNKPKNLQSKTYPTPKNGKKGRGGGIKNMEVARACLAAKGY